MFGAGRGSPTGEQRRSSRSAPGCWPTRWPHRRTSRAWTGGPCHRLRHSALTHDAEGGTSTPMLLARSRHVSVRSLERYARPGVDTLARHVAARDPAARRRAELLKPVPQNGERTPAHGRSPLAVRVPCQWLPASSPVSLPWRSALGSFRPVISTVLPRWAYFVSMASRAATEEASQMCAALRSMTTFPGSPA